MDLVKLQEWLREQAAEERRDEEECPDPIERYRIRGRREAFEEVHKRIDYSRGLR